MTEEYLDVVNEDNKVIGQEKRRIVHQSGLWHRGVHVFLFTPERRLLVQRRSRAQDTFPNALDCSVSEHLRVGESYREGAVRGLSEELGIDGVRLSRLLRLKMAYGPGDNMINELYEGVCEDQALTIDHHEIEHIATYTLPELEEMMDKICAKIGELYKSGENEFCPVCPESPAYYYLATGKKTAWFAAAEDKAHKTAAEYFAADGTTLVKSYRDDLNKSATLGVVFRF